MSTRMRSGARSDARANAAAESPDSEGGRGNADRPRERLGRVGPAALADAQLIALILRTGSGSRDAEELAHAMLDAFEGMGGLSRAGRGDLAAHPGIGPVKAASLVAAFELAHRVSARRLEQSEPIRSPADVQRHFQARLRSEGRESFHVLLLDGRHRLICEERVSIGTLTASLVHPREVFREAIARAAAALLLVHNHPSGDPAPSREDRVVTKRLRAAGGLIGIEVLDHVIVADAGHYSFREAGEFSD